MSRSVDFKTSVALALFDQPDVTYKDLMGLIGRPKPPGQHHMRFTPADLRAARYRLAGLDPNTQDPPLLPPQERDFPPIVVFRMSKGGVGKSTLSVNCAAAMAMMGFKVLMIDVDPQASASNIFGVDSNYMNDIKHIGHFLLVKSSKAPDSDLNDAIMNIYDDGYLDLIAADITLTDVDARMVTEMNSHSRALLFLQRNAVSLSQHYDVIVVDSAPGTTPIGLAFTYAAHTSKKIITVVEPEGSCLKALDSLSSNLNEIEATTGTAVGMQIVINKYHPKLKHVRENMALLYQKYGNQLNDNIIPNFAGFARQMDADPKKIRPLIESDPASIGSQAIIGFALSVVQSFGITQPGLSSLTNE